MTEFYLKAKNLLIRSGFNCVGSALGFETFDYFYGGPHFWIMIWFYQNQITIRNYSDSTTLEKIDQTLAQILHLAPLYFAGAQLKLKPNMACAVPIGLNSSIRIEYTCPVGSNPGGYILSDRVLGSDKPIQYQINFDQVPQEWQALLTQTQRKYNDYIYA